MIWRMRNHLRFQQEITIHMAIEIIKNYVRLFRNYFKKFMNNEISDFSFLILFAVNTWPIKILHPIQLFGVFVKLVGLKSIQMVLPRVLPILLHVMGFLEAICESLLVDFLLSSVFNCPFLLNSWELSLLLNKLNRLDIFVYG